MQKQGIIRGNLPVNVRAKIEVKDNRNNYGKVEWRRRMIMHAKKKKGREKQVSGNVRIVKNMGKNQKGKGKWWNKMTLVRKREKIEEKNNKCWEGVTRKGYERTKL